MIFDRDLQASRRTRQANLVRVETLRGLAIAKCQLRRQVLRLITKDYHVPLSCRLLAAQRMRLLTGLKTLSRLSQRCRVSGRQRQVLRFGGLSRMHLRQQFHERLVPSLVQKRW